MSFIISTRHLKAWDGEFVSEILTGKNKLITPAVNITEWVCYSDCFSN
jgi:hypothetical protein